MGASGAEVILLPPDRALKLGPGDRIGDRVEKQGRWLHAIGDGLHGVVHDFSLPRVDVFFANGYVMEMLTEPNWDVLDAGRIIARMTELLWRDVWSQRTQFVGPMFELDAFERYIKTNTGMQIASGFAYETIVDLMDDVPWGALQVVPTHGDPTLDNVMFRDGNVVLIDPIPREPHHPPFRAWDAGKILQSVYGYETARYGVEFNSLPNVSEALRGIPPEEHFAARYFCAVHYARLLPYQEAPLIPAMKDILDEVCRDLRS